MKHLEVIKLKDRIKSSTFSEERLEEAATKLAEIETKAFQDVCQVMAEAWGDEVLPLARTLLSSKKALTREKGLELFAHQPDLSLIAELEQAKGRDRAKKLHRQYDYAMRRIRRAHERTNPAADPRDLEADPLARLKVLAAMPYQQLWEMLDIQDRYWGHVGLPTEGDDTDAKRIARLESLLGSGQTQPLWLVQLLFHAHPFAGDSAVQLVWEGKGDEDWVSFRWARDGRPCDPAGESVALPIDAPVRLAHPIELSPATRDAWLEVARSEGWDAPFDPLTVPLFPPAQHSWNAVVAAAPPLDERKARAWLEANGFEASWDHEHERPHATAHAVVDDRCRPWLRLHHDAIAARRTGNDPIRLTRIELPKSTPRRHSEAVRLVHALGEHAGVR